MSLFNNQYNLIYLDRIHRLKKKIYNNLTNHQKAIYKDTLSELEKQTDICCIGQVFINSSKPTIFDDINKPNNNFSKENYLQKEMQYELEDNYGKVKIKFENQPFIVTGQVLGIEGKVEGGIIFVQKIIYPNEMLNNTVEDTLTLFNNETIMFISNIDSDYEFEFFLDLLKKNYVHKLIIIGIKNKTNFLKLRQILQRIKDLQIFLIPDYFTLTNTIPYEPINLELTINSFSNPVMIENCLFLPNAVFKDLLKYHPKGNNEEACIDVLELLNKSQHCCPTAPDTVKCIPFENDPFIFNKQVNYLIVGGEEFVFKKLKNLYFLSVPNFSKYQKTVLFKNGIAEIVKYKI